MLIFNEDLYLGQVVPMGFSLLPRNMCPQPKNGVFSQSHFISGKVNFKIESEK